MLYIYVLESIKFKKRYVGFTTDLERRLEEQNKGRTKSNKAFRPYKIIYFEVTELREEARKREKYLKSSGGRIFINKNRPHSSAE